MPTTPRKASAKSSRKRASKRASKKPVRRTSRAARTGQRGAKGKLLSFVNWGRKTVCTPDTVDEVCGYIAEGLSVVNACIYAGIAESTYHEWQRRARVEYERLGNERVRIAKERDCPPETVEVEPLESELPFIIFSESVKRARALFQLDNLRIVKSGVERWQSSAWLLERRIPDEFAVAKRGGSDAPAPQAKGNEPADRVVGRYTEIYVGGEQTPPQEGVAQGAVAEPIPAAADRARRPVDEDFDDEDDD